MRLITLIVLTLIAGNSYSSDLVLPQIEQLKAKCEKVNKPIYEAEYSLDLDINLKKNDSDQSIGKVSVVYLYTKEECSDLKGIFDYTDSFLAKSKNLPEHEKYRIEEGSCTVSDSFDYYYTPLFPLIEKTGKLIFSDNMNANSITDEMATIIIDYKTQTEILRKNMNGIFSFEEIFPIYDDNDQITEKDSFTFNCKIEKVTPFSHE